MITFDNYTIKPLELEDLKPYFHLVEWNSKRLEDFYTGTVSRTKDLTATHIFREEIIIKRKAKEYYPFILVDNKNNTIISFIDLKNIDWTIPKTEIGCYTDYNFSGKGLTTKAMKLFINYCFTHFEFKKIYLRTHHSNKAARQVAVKCGFELEGTLRIDYKTTPGKLVDLMYYGTLNTK